MEKDPEPNDLNSISNRIMTLVGATATVSIIVLILYLLKVIPEKVSLAIAFFISLPLVYSFVFGIIFNKPDFHSVIRHYSLTLYLIIALTLFMIFLKPSSITEGIRYTFYFFLGLVLATISYFFYSVGYRLSKKLKYRWKAILGFGISFIVTFSIAFTLEHYNIFELI